MTHNVPMAQAYFLDTAAPTPSIPLSADLRVSQSRPASLTWRLVGVFEGRNLGASAVSESSIAPGVMLNENHHNHRQPVTGVCGAAVFSRSLLKTRVAHGRWTLRSSGAFHAGSAASRAGPAAGDSQARGVLEYPLVCQYLLRDSVDPDGMCSYAVRFRDWVAYEGIQSLPLKLSRMGSDIGMPGLCVAVWDLAFDDFRGDCGNSRSPLLRGPYTGRSARERSGSFRKAPPPANDRSRLEPRTATNIVCRNDVVHVVLAALYKRATSSLVTNFKNCVRSCSQ
ncbi:hypothetical protein MTO96_036406 [Rhipicephalus appendiculatus]